MVGTTVYIGDYQRLVAFGTRFYGAFSASNEVKLTNFPVGVFYQRWIQPGLGALVTHDRPLDTPGSLLDDGSSAPGAGVEPPVSIDPYFFTISAGFVV